MIIDTNVTVTFDIVHVITNVLQIVGFAFLTIVVLSLIGGYFYDREMSKTQDLQSKIDKEIDRLHK